MKRLMKIYPLAWNNSGRCQFKWPDGKNPAARSRAGLALALTKAHFSKIKNEDLQLVGDGNRPGKNFLDHLPTFLEAASKIASIIDLETYVEPTGVPNTPKDAPIDEEEEDNE